MGSGVIVTLLRPLTALLKDPGSIPSVYNLLTSLYISSSRSSYRVFWTSQIPGMYMVHRLTYRQNTHMHKIVKVLKNRESVYIVIITKFCKFNEPIVAIFVFCYLVITHSPPFSLVLDDKKYT